MTNELHTIVSGGHQIMFPFIRTMLGQVCNFTAYLTTTTLTNIWSLDSNAWKPNLNKIKKKKNLNSTKKTIEHFDIKED